jgi:hypothetical protein
MSSGVSPEVERLLDDLHRTAFMSPEQIEIRKRLRGHVPHPQFCHQVERCAGLRSCPATFSCTE